MRNSAEQNKGKRNENENEIFISAWENISNRKAHCIFLDKIFSSEFQVLKLMNIHFVHFMRQRSKIEI